jgi:RNA polymerase sigma-70 factor (ECF subfamily)
MGAIRRARDPRARDLVSRTDESGLPQEPGARERCRKNSRDAVTVETAEVVEARPGTPPVAARAEAVGEISDPDADLVTAWQAGDESAFDALVRRHQRRVFGLVLRMLGSREEAEEVAQEAFLSLHRHGHRFRREARFSTFVYRVAANAALNRRRSLGRKRAREEALARRQEAGLDLPASPRDPEDAASGIQIQARVQEALLELPPDLRAAVVLYDIEGQSYGDIAHALRIPEGTVKSRIHRARNALRELLRPLARAGSGGVGS